MKKETWVILNYENEPFKIVFSCQATDHNDCWRQLEANPPALFDDGFDFLTLTVSLSALQNITKQVEALN